MNDKNENILICKNYYCELPVTNKEDLIKSLNIIKK